MHAETHIDTDVWHIEHGQGNVEFVCIKMQVFRQPVNSRIPDIRPVNECKQPQSKQPWNDMSIELARESLVKFWIDNQIIPTWIDLFKVLRMLVLVDLLIEYAVCRIVEGRRIRHID